MPTVERVRHESRLRLLVVRAVEDLTPRLRRITLAGDDLDDFRSTGADDHLKLLFANTDPHGPALARRDFTPRRCDPEAGELVVDFVLHGDGPASSWAAAAAPGALVGQSGPRGSRVADGFDWYLLAGDETALPAIGRRLEELPAGTRAIVIAEVEDRAGELALPSAADVSLTWLHRAAGEPGAPLLEEAIRALELPPGDGFAWVAAEADAVRPIRRHLREERGLPKPWTRVTGYWRRGTVNHHDSPEEDA